MFERELNVREKVPDPDQRTREVVLRCPRQARRMYRSTGQAMTS